MYLKVEEYFREDGTSPYEEWFMRLDTVAAAKITSIRLLEDKGGIYGSYKGL